MSDEEPGTRTVITRTGAPRAAGDDRAHYIVAVEGAERGRRIEVAASLVIGREEPATVVLADSEVSRKHCKVALIMGEVFLTDLGSSNGTFVGGERISGSRIIAPGVRFTIGGHVFEHEWRSRKEVESARDLDSDIAKAGRYIRALLPPPLSSGPVQTDWVLQPCARLGGDAFGYHFIDARTFAIYLLDVTGHGADAAMHAVSVMNVLRQTALPGVDVRDPARMAGYVNEMFPMERHGNMLASLWYGVCDLPSRTLTFTSGGHHPSYLVAPGTGAATPLDVENVIIGMVPAHDFRTAQVAVPPGSSLYLFSDGAYEIETADGREWGIGDLVPLLALPRQSGKGESQRVLEAVSERTGRRTFEDDFTLVVATFA